MPCQTPYRGDTSQMLLFKIASCLEASGGGGVLSFNGRTGDVILTLADVAAVADDIYVNESGDTMTGALVHPDGTAALPSITFTGDLNTGIYHPAADELGFSTGGFERVRIDSAGFVGIGTTNPLMLLYALEQTDTPATMRGIHGVLIGNTSHSAHITARKARGTEATPLILQVDDGAGAFTSEGYNGVDWVRAGYIRWVVTNNTANVLSTKFTVATSLADVETDRMIILPDGKVGIGSSTPTARFHIVGDGVTFNQWYITNTTVLRQVNEVYSNTASDEAQVNLRHARGTIAVPTNTLLNDSVGSFRFAGYNEALPGFQAGAAILAFADGDFGSAGDDSDAPTRLEFQTTANGSSARITRIYIGSDGNVGIGTTTPTSGRLVIDGGDLSLLTAIRLSVASGANTRAGNATLVAGTVTVANTTVTAATIVLITRKTSGGTPGFAITYTVIAATSFTITSDNALDTSTLSYFLIENP